MSYDLVLYAGVISLALACIAMFIQDDEGSTA